MVLFNYYLELWILGFSVLGKYLVFKHQRPPLSDPENKLKEAGRNIAMGAGFLVLFGLIAFWELPDIQAKGQELGFNVQILEEYLVRPFQGWVAFLTSPLFAVIAIAIHHIASFFIHFNPYHRAVTAETFHKQVSRAGMRMLNTFLLLFFSIPAVLFLVSSAAAARGTFLEGVLNHDVIADNLGFLIPIVFILFKTYVDVRAHIRSNSNWIGDGVDGDLFYPD